MIPRRCPECDSELVRSKCTDQQSVPGTVQATSPAWRCSVCGRVFTTGQIRENHRAKSQSKSQANLSIKRAVVVAGL